MRSSGSAALVAALLLVIVVLSYALALAGGLEVYKRQQPGQATGTLELLEEREYYARLVNIVGRANESVYVTMFVIKYDPGDPDDPVNDVLALLCSKASQGLDVRVLVDDTTARDYPQTIAYLKSCGVKVKVWWGRPNLHAKMVIVDGKHLLVGSHNWTESALKYNVEVSVYSRDPKAVEEALKLFERLWAHASSA